MIPTLVDDSEAFKTSVEGFPAGSVVKNPPANAGDMGSIAPEHGKIPYTSDQLSLCTTAIGPVP